MLLTNPRDCIFCVTKRFTIERFVRCVHAVVSRKPRVWLRLSRTRASVDMTACTWDLQRDNSSVADILHISWDKYIWTFWQWNHWDSDIQLMKNKQLLYPLEYYLFLLFPTVTVSLKLVFLYSNLFSFSYRKTFIFTYELMIYIKKYFSVQLNWNFFPSSLYLNQTILFTYKLIHDLHN